MAAGGFKMSLGGLKAQPGLKGAGLKNSNAANGTKPKKALLGDDEPEDTNQAQQIAAFDAAQGGAIDINGPAEKKGPLVIPSLPNRNWRDEARKRKAQLEKAPHTKQSTEDVVMEEPEKEVVYGLTVPSQPLSDDPHSSHEPPTAGAMDVDNADPDASLTPAQRLEQAALEHLLHGKSTDTQRIVPALTDAESLSNDLSTAPDAPSLAAYEATPIEGFGLAMLRGMGWKDSDGETRTSQKEIKRRPALLGIGAKEDAAKDVELGEFNSKARPKKGRKDGDGGGGYNPVALRNKKTGEVVSEEELKRKLESQDLVTEETGGEGDERERKKSRRDGYDSERRRDRDGKDDRRSDRRDRDTRRDRDRSRSPRDSKRRPRYRSRSRSRSLDSKDRRRRRDRSRSRDRDRDDEERRRRRRKERDRDDEREDRHRRDRDARR